MAEIKGTLPGPNLTLTPRERAWVKWLAIADARLGAVDFEINMKISQTNKVSGDINVGVRAKNMVAWKEMASRYCDADIVADPFVIDKSTGEVRGVLRVRVRVDV